MKICAAQSIRIATATANNKNCICVRARALCLNLNCECECELWQRRSQTKHTVKYRKKKEIMGISFAIFRMDFAFLALFSLFDFFLLLLLLSFSNALLPFAFTAQSSPWPLIARGAWTATVHHSYIVRYDGTRYACMLQSSWIHLNEFPRHIGTHNSLLMRVRVHIARCAILPIFFFFSSSGFCVWRGCSSLMLRMNVCAMRSKDVSNSIECVPLTAQCVCSCILCSRIACLLTFMLMHYVKHVGCLLGVSPPGVVASVEVGAMDLCNAARVQWHT